MNIFEKMQKLDRRWIYLVLAIAVILPLIFPYNSRTYTSSPTESLYRMIDSLRPPEGTDPLLHNRAFLMEVAHDAGTNAELFPMELAVLRHAFQRNIKVFTIAFYPTSAPIMDLALNTVKKEFAENHGRTIVSGVDYANFGYKLNSLQIPIILGMGDNIAAAVEIDSEGRPVANLPIMTNINTFDEMTLVTQFSGSVAGGNWVVLARPRFGVNVGVGVTAVTAADLYPSLQTGQLVGMLGGLKGAAEYERLVDMFAMQNREFTKEIVRNELDDPRFAIRNDRIPYVFKQARIGMNAQSVVHMLIILFILLGNIGYFVQKYKQNDENR